MKLLLRTTLLLSLLAIIASCTSRYKYDLYQTADDIRRKVKVESTKYIPNRVLGDPNSPEKFIPGNGNTIVVTTGTRGLTREVDTYSVLRFDEYLRCDIYVEIDGPLKLDTIELKDNSYLWIKGRYDQSPGSRLFYPDSGQLSGDSLKSGRIYGTLVGVWINADKVPLSFDGYIKVKYKD